MSAFQPRYTAEELYLMKQLAAQKLDRAVTCKESLEHASIASYTSPPPLIHSAHASSYNSSTSSPEETPDHGHGVERGISILELKELTRLRLLNELNSSVSPRAPASASVYHSAFSANPLGNRPVSVTEAIRSSAKYGLPPDQCYHITDYGSLLTTGPMLVRQPLHVNPPPLVSSQHDPNTWCTSSFPYIGPPSLRRHSLPEFSTFSDYNFNRDTSPFELFTEEGASQLHALKVPLCHCYIIDFASSIAC